MQALTRLAAFPLTIARVVWDYTLLAVLVIVLLAAALVGAALLPTVAPFLFVAFWLAVFLYVTAGVIGMMYAPGRGDRTHAWGPALRLAVLGGTGLLLAWGVWWASCWIGLLHAWLVDVAAQAVRPATVLLADKVWPPMPGVPSRAGWLADRWLAFADAPLGAWHIDWPPLLGLLPDGRPSLWVLLMPLVLWAVYRRIRQADRRLTRIENAP